MTPPSTTTQGDVRAADQSPQERWRDRALVVAFALGLAFPLVAMLFGWGRSDSASEKRLLAPFPALAPDAELRAEVALEGGGALTAWSRALEQWPKRYEVWYDDNFAFRSELIHWHHRMYVEGVGVSPRPDVVIGKEGWLFTNASDQEQAALDQVRGLFPFSAEQLRELQRFFEECRDWFEDRGIPYYLTIAPSKPSIHPEYLPSSLALEDPVTRLDQLCDWLAATPERDGYQGVQLVDLRPALLAAKGEHGTLYRRTDTHWNGVGALIASEALVESMRPAFPALPPLAPSQFEFKRVVSGGGDLAASLSLASVLEDELVEIRALEPVELTREVEGMVPVRIPEMAIGLEDTLAEERRRPFRLVQQRQDLPRLLMFRDSYASNLVPFLARAFSSSAFYWQYRIHDPAIMALERPDVVVQQIGERVLMRNVGLPRNEPFIVNDLPSLRGFRASTTSLARVEAEGEGAATWTLPLDQLPKGQAVLVRVAGDFVEGGTVRIRLVPRNQQHPGWVLKEHAVVAWRDVVYARAEKPRQDHDVVVEVEAPGARGVVAEVRAVPRRAETEPAQ